MNFTLLKDRVKFKVLQPFLAKRNFLLENAIIIASEPRSGSTWMMELFGQLEGCIVNWEPLHPINGVVPKDIELGTRVYLTENDDTDRFRQFFARLLTYKISNQWTAKYVSFGNLSSSKYVVTKFVRANNLLPWFDKHLNLRYKPILLMRHPITTCISQLKNFHQTTGSSMTEAYKEGEVYSAPQCLNNERFVSNEEYINSLKTPLERQVALWCINNVWMFDSKESESWIMVYYEEMVRRPQEELERVILELELPFTKQDLEKVVFDKASKSTSSQFKVDDYSAQLESFLKKLDKGYLMRLQEILDRFGITKYSASDAYPQY